MDKNGFEPNEEEYMKARAETDAIISVYASDGTLIIDKGKVV